MRELENGPLVFGSTTQEWSWRVVRKNPLTSPSFSSPPGGQLICEERKMKRKGHMRTTWLCWLVRGFEEAWWKDWRYAGLERRRVDVCRGGNAKCEAFCVPCSCSQKIIHPRRGSKVPRGWDDLANRCQLVPVLDIAGWCRGLRGETVERCRPRVNTIPRLTQPPALLSVWPAIHRDRDQCWASNTRPALD